MKYALLAIFGLGGVFARYIINSFVTNTLPHNFPVATVSINIIGSFLIGVTYVLGAQYAFLTEDQRLAIIVGFLGGFTTFSAFSLDVVSMMGEGRFASCALYVVLSVGGGIAATVLGMLIAKYAAGAV